MASSHASELKSQGAMEAARDPDSNVTPQAAENTFLAEAKKGGSVAVQFDPDATAEEKAAQLQSHVPAGFHHERNPKAISLVSDVDDGTGTKYDLPPASKAGAIAPTSTSKEATANGHLPEDDEDRWDRVGWAPRFGQLGAGEEEEEEEEGNMLDHQTWLEGKLQDKFFGDWYYNTGVIIFACLSSWVVAVLGGGLGWVFIIMAICGTYYRTSLRRVRRNFRDDINRELAKNKLETDTETLEWINSFLVKFWPIFAPVLCETIVNSVDQVLSTATPAFLDSLRMKQFILGTKPPRLEHVKTYPKAEDDIVLMDWKFSFTPNDTADLTARQIKNKINPKVVLEIRVGKGLVSKGLDVIVEDFAFSGLMRVKFKLQIPFPHIEKVEICFLERPTIDYVCKPLGGETFGFDINFIPGLESFISEQIHANLGPMMYDPNVFPIEIAKMLAGNAVDQAIGVLQVTFHGAQGLKNPDKFSGTPDPYATVSINQRTELGRTKTVHESANPRWNETVNVIITSLKDALTIQVYDYNEYRKDKELGVATFQLEQLEAEAEYENQHIEVMANGRARGLVQCDVRFFPVLEGAKLQDGTVEPPPESMTGIARFTVEQAKELDGSKSLIGQLNPYAVLLLNGKEIHISKKLKRTNQPIFPDASKEVLITDRKKAKFGLVIKDDRDLGVDPIVGTYQIGLDDMLDLMSKGNEWYNLAGVKTGRAKMLLQWKPVGLKGALGGSGGYVTPIGVMRLHFQNARNLRNVETMGKSDPYVRVLLSGVEKGRTVTFKNNLNPDWDEVIYVPMHSRRERLLLEVMDEENLGKDRSLGHVEISSADYIHQDENGEYLVNEQRQLRSEGLSTGPGSIPKGILNFTCSFYPTYNVVDPDDEEKESAKERPSTANTQKSNIPSMNGSEAPRKSTDSARKSLDEKNNSTGSNTLGTIPSLKTRQESSELDLAKQLEKGEKDQEGTVVPEKKEIPKIRLTPEDLSQYESGLIVFKLIDGEFTHTNCYVEVVMDDMAFPSYSSTKVRSRQTTFNEIGDTLVRELDFSKITLRLMEHIDKKGEGSEDKIIAKLTGSTLDTLRRCLYTPTQLTMKDQEGRENKITVSLKYLPVKMRLDPSESFNNQGTLRVDVLDAADLPAADRNGFSDPYCKFTLNEKEVYKTKIQKKTLHPAWNEFFEVSVRSRTAAKFEVVVYDWDFGEKADLLGKAAINLEILEPFMAQEVTLGLDGKSGAVRLKMLFKPDYVVRSRQGSSTFSGTFAAPGKVIGAPVKGVGKGAVLVGGVVGGGVVKGASLLGRGFRRRKSHSANGDEQLEREATPNGSLDESVPAISMETANGNGDANASTVTPTPSPHARNKSWGAQSISSHFGGASTGVGEHGIAHLTIVSASDYPPGTNVRVHVKVDSPKGAKEVFKTKHIKAPNGSVSFENESVKVPCAADSQFKILVKDHATFGSDSELGEGVFFVDDQGTGGEKVVSVGSGKVVVKSSFMPADAGSVVGAVGGSPRLSKRFLSTGGKRDSRDNRERIGTPGL
ncbi:tricalbin [Lepidopterella palustris CBS 459.81]|uniref:Tricalbin n=1 Tax=Lepidopterella palustris CBS 459.81 TaxID=1314670 RepID=A0A8E2EG27_9PEZI|nr:tricalbin [Lepidopterella palustris CBS 459.81]